MSKSEQNSDKNIFNELEDAAKNPTVTNRMHEILDSSSCAGCPVLSKLIDSEGGSIDRMRDAAADPDFFQSIIDESSGFTGDGEGLPFLRIIGAGDVGVATIFDPERDASLQTGEHIEHLLNIADERERVLTKFVQERISGCPGALKVAGHDNATRQVFEITACSEQELTESNDGIVSARVNLQPDV